MRIESCLEKGLFLNPSTYKRIEEFREGLTREKRPFRRESKRIKTYNPILYIETPIFHEKQ